MKKLHTSIFALTLFFAVATAEASPRQEVLAGPLTGTVLSILDGDTVSVRLKVWIGQELETSVRIAGIDTPEMKGKCAKETALAIEARNEVQRLLKDGSIVLSTIKLEKYAGRVLAHATTLDGINNADHLIDKGLARPYAGKKRAGWCS